MQGMNVRMQVGPRPSKVQYSSARDDAADWMRCGGDGTIPGVELTTWRLVAVEKDAQVVPPLS